MFFFNDLWKDLLSQVLETVKLLEWDMDHTLLFIVVVEEREDWSTADHLLVAMPMVMLEFSVSWRQVSKVSN